MILPSETSGRVLRLRAERHLDALDMIPHGILELNGSLPKPGFIHGFEYQRVQTRAEDDTLHRLLSRNRAVRDDGLFFLRLPCGSLLLSGRLPYLGGVIPTASHNVPTIRRKAYGRDTTLVRFDREQFIAAGRIP